MTVLSVNSRDTILSRNSRRSKAGASKLNLVSLMDIFTILVFFLMLNTGDVEVLQPDEKNRFAEVLSQIAPRYLTGHQSQQRYPVL